MSGLVVPQVVYGLSNDELAELVAKALKEIDWAFNGNISDQNISRIANFIASKTELKHISGIVGISGYDPGNPEAIRIWAGHADKTFAPFRVQQDGKMYATDGEFTGSITGSTIIGSEIMTDVVGNYPRAEMSSIDNLFTAEATANESIEIASLYTGSPSILFKEGGSVKGSMAVPSGGGLGVVTAGTTDINLQSARDLKLEPLRDVLLNPSNNLKINGSNGYTGSFSVVDSVDFVGETVSYTTITVTKGIITNVS